VERGEDGSGERGRTTEGGNQLMEPMTLAEVGLVLVQVSRESADHGPINRGNVGEVQVKESKNAKILPIRALKLGPTQFQAEVERLQASGRMPSLEKLLAAVADTRGEYREKILAARKRGKNRE
jgi:hypothetical protein